MVVSHRAGFGVAVYVHYSPLLLSGMLSICRKLSPIYVLWCLSVYLLWCSHFTVPPSTNHPNLKEMEGIDDTGTLIRFRRSCMDSARLKGAAPVEPDSQLHSGRFRCPSPGECCGCLLRHWFTSFLPGSMHALLGGTAYGSCGGAEGQNGATAAQQECFIHADRSSEAT